MDGAPLPHIFLYERTGCHLCEQTRTHLEQLLASWAAAGRPVPQLVGRDIDTDDGWQRAFLETIPVVEIAGRRLELATSRVRVQGFVEEALESARATAGARTFGLGWQSSDGASGG